MKISESQAITNFLHDIKNSGGWGYKLPDIGRTQKPFDFLFLDCHGITHFVEAKLCKNRTLHFSQIRDNQRTALSRIQKIQGKNKACMLCVCDQTGETKLIDFDILLQNSTGKITF